MVIRQGDVYWVDLYEPVGSRPGQGNLPRPSVASATLWSAAFALFTVAYWAILSHPRLDGQPG